MENNVASTAPLHDIEPVQPVRSSVPAAAPAAPEPRQDQADLRLVIEENGHTGTFVYKTIDRRTGEVVSQIPREEVLKMQHAEGYESGTVIKTQA
ncbi:flagellar protein FlaG [Phenylobacterium sp.]|uniref:flagellar protein FlaG n=1 Tax=Phenylobacterium sp. TaxID=1871053 RepID=UPI0035B44C59